MALRLLHLEPSFLSLSRSTYDHQTPSQPVLHDPPFKYLTTTPCSCQPRERTMTPRPSPLPARITRPPPPTTNPEHPTPLFSSATQSPTPSPLSCTTLSGSNPHHLSPVRSPSSNQHLRKTAWPLCKIQHVLAAQSPCRISSPCCLTLMN